MIHHVRGLLLLGIPADSQDTLNLCIRNQTHLFVELSHVSLERSRHGNEQMMSFEMTMMIATTRLKIR